MSESSLERVSTFNRELAALAACGLPLDIGLRGNEKITDRLEQINTSLAARVGRGQSLEQAISDAPELPDRYRAALRTWIQSDDPAVALGAVAANAEARTDFSHSVGRTLSYPLVVLVLAYFAFLVLCSFTAPSIEAIYTQLYRPQSDSLSLLTTSRDLIPWWGVLLPVLVVSALCWWRLRGRRSSWNWLPGSGRYYRAMRNANMAQQLATLLDSGCSLDDSLTLVCPMYLDGQTTTVAKDSLPTLLRWAVTADLGGEPMPNVLRFVAETYCQSAARRKSFWRVVMPTVGGVVLGGILVLAFGLGLFIPVVELLHEVSLAGGK